MNNELRIIISGGGTGGHIFPAVSIANAIKAAIFLSETITIASGIGALAIISGVYIAER